MIASKTARMAIALTALVLLSACANTIRGVGEDTANTVNATQSAGRDVGHAAKH